MWTATASMRNMRRQEVDRTVAVMETLLEMGVEQVDVRRVLRLLGREVPERADAPEPQPRLDPRADPLTGCLPVTAQGGHNASSDQEEDRGARRGGFRG